MKSILQAIGRMLRAMRRAAAGVVKQTVMIGGKLVTLFLPAALPAIDELEPDDAAAPANDNAPISPNAAIRDLAYCQAMGRLPTAAQLGAVTQLQCDWIAALDADMARRVLKASDAEINAHIRGTRAIRGVLWCDEAAIDDYTTAVVIDQARLERDARLEAAMDTGSRQRR